MFARKSARPSVSPFARLISTHVRAKSMRGFSLFECIILYRII